MVITEEELDEILKKIIEDKSVSGNTKELAEKLLQVSLAKTK